MGMRRNELATTLLQVIEAVGISNRDGMVVTEADIELPLEISSAVRDGKLVFFGSAPHTRWKSGVLPHLNLGRIHIALEDGCGD